MTSCLGLKTRETPREGGKQFNQKTMAPTISAVIRGGIFINGSVFMTQRHLSLTVRIYRSIAGTCSPSPQMLPEMPVGRSWRRHSNCPSARNSVTWKDRVAYNLKTRFNAVRSVLASKAWMRSEVPNRNLVEIVTIKWIPFTVITSPAIVTTL